MKINVYGTETYTVSIVREPVEIDTTKYPELAGKTEAQAIAYITQHINDMVPTKPQDSVTTLFDECKLSFVKTANVSNNNKGITFTP
jgi:hypothetical protein